LVEASDRVGAHDGSDDASQVGPRLCKPEIERALSSLLSAGKPGTGFVEINGHGSQQSFEDRDRQLQSFLDAAESLEPLGAEGVVFGRETPIGKVLVQGGFHPLEPLLRGEQARLQELAIGVSDQAAEFGHHLEEVLAIAGDSDLADGAPTGQLTGAGAGAALADVEGFGDFVERERLGGEEEEAVDLAEGSGQPDATTEVPGGLDELEAGARPERGDAVPGRFYCRRGGHTSSRSLRAVA